MITALALLALLPVDHGTFFTTSIGVPGGIALVCGYERQGFHANVTALFHRTGWSLSGDCMSENVYFFSVSRDTDGLHIEAYKLVPAAPPKPATVHLDQQPLAPPPSQPTNAKSAPPELPK
ncbi:MAG TPA: hypothetical protein VFA18_07550 [Gemmataceae bacterium]|nr:hypothetical protein [Gemmataceae bacterium]